MQKENTPTYGVFILRRNGDNIFVMESTNFDSAHERWSKLHETWSQSLDDNKPFILNDPIVTAFDPGLIYEIVLKPVAEKATQTNSNNPYSRMMQENGFSNSMKNFSTGGDVLDKGYL